MFQIVDITKCKSGVDPATSSTAPDKQLRDATATVLQIQKESVDLQVHNLFSWSFPKYAQ